jgi:hypothetical protein
MRWSAPGTSRGGDGPGGNGDDGAPIDPGKQIARPADVRFPGSDWRRGAAAIVGVPRGEVFTGDAVIVVIQTIRV